jgi:hypothetical protein
MIYVKREGFPRRIDRDRMEILYENGAGRGEFQMRRELPRYEIEVCFEVDEEG